MSAASAETMVEPTAAGLEAGADRFASTPCAPERWRLAKRLLRGGRSAVHSAVAVVNLRLRNWCAASDVLAGMYYTLCSNAFRREQRALLCGLRDYQRVLDSGAGNRALLRRNTHRLEKGLLMRPRREVFAVGYIGETVDCFQSLFETGCGTIETGSDLHWARDVLSRYFELSAKHPQIDAARVKFQRILNGGCETPRELVPYERDLREKPPVGIDALLALAHRRRSVRWFLDRPVPREMIDRAVEVAAQSPSACNRQPFEFRVLDDPKMVREASVLPMGTAGFAENIPVFVVVVGQQRNYFDERDRHLIYIDSSLAVMGFVYALEAQGLSSCCINWPDIEHREQRMADLLQLKADERPIMCLAVGYPDPEGLVAYSQKKPVTQLRRYNFE